MHHGTEVSPIAPGAADLRIDPIFGSLQMCCEGRQLGWGDLAEIRRALVRVLDSQGTADLIKQECAGQEVHTCKLR